MEYNFSEKMLLENRYMRPDKQVEDTYTPVDLYGGLKFKFSDQLIFNAFAGCKSIKNQYFFVNRDLFQAGWSGFNNSFDVVYSKTNVSYTGASLNYNWTKKLDILLKGTYKNWDTKDCEYAWQRPNWELNLDANYKITPDIKISLNSFLLGKRYAFDMYQGAVEMKPIYDISLEGIYEHNSWLSVFLKLNNILNKNYQIWYGYNSQGFNALGGVMLSF
jgi:hypothetical protein